MPIPAVTVPESGISAVGEPSRAATARSFSLEGVSRPSPNNPALPAGIVRPLDGLALLDEYLARYTNLGTQKQEASRLAGLFHSAGKRHPADLTEAELLTWCSAPAANNTVRVRLSTARTFFRWCIRTGIVSDDPSADLHRLKKLYPKTYGKVQSAYPPNGSRRQAFGALLTACQDGSWLGSRDQLAIRLGLMGCRSGDVLSMTWGDLRPDGRFMWMGKGRRQRTITPGPTFAALLARWRRAYEAGIGRPIAPTDPLICRGAPGRGRPGEPRRITWGQPISSTYYNIVESQAAAAGLGHLTPHDLRRSAAGILHDSVTPDGGHLYDLFDIQKVLDHACPTTTQRSYLSPMSDSASAPPARARSSLVHPRRHRHRRPPADRSARRVDQPARTHRCWSPPPACHHGLA